MDLRPQDKKRIQNLLESFEQNKNSIVGYPVSSHFNCECLEPFLRYNINNCGDWAQYSNNPLNTFQFQKQVIMYFAYLYKIKFDQCWGYVTNGGTQGNIFSCFLARELFPEGTLYYSEDTHYSVSKIIKLLRIKSRSVKSQSNGIIDYQDLINKIIQDKQPHPIIFANIGTTFLGAVDDVVRIQQLLEQQGYKRQDYYIHADAALSGMVLPFVQNPEPFTFEVGIDSISVSGHKMIGAPMPCGIVITKKKYMNLHSQQIEYLMARDKTISGSRNGLSPLILWKALKSSTKQDFKAQVRMCFYNADYIIKRLNQKGIKAWRHKNSMTVVIPCPSQQVVRKHRLAPTNGMAHIIAMPHHRSPNVFDNLIQDLIQDYCKVKECKYGAQQIRNKEEQVSTDGSRNQDINF